MAAGQRELCFVMIKARFLPVRVTVAGRAVLAEFALVDIVALMAGDTGSLQFLAIDRACMALVAR